MPVGEVHLRLGVPAPGVLVAPSQPPAPLPPGDGNQGGDEGGEEVADSGGQGEGVTVVFHQGGVLLLRVDLGQIAWDILNLNREGAVPTT